MKISSLNSVLRIAYCVLRCAKVRGIAGNIMYKFRYGRADDYPPVRFRYSILLGRMIIRPYAKSKILEEISRAA